jgi:hypothetical protein
MAAHVVLPSVAPEPATLSPAWLGTELRGRLGFRGAVVSDDLEMGALDGLGTPEQVAVAATRAGCDLLIYRSEAATRHAYEALIHALENGKLPDLLNQSNARRAAVRQTLDGYINYWVLRPFIIAKGNKRGKLEMHAVVSPNNLSHRRAAELTGGTVLNIDSDFSGPLAALGDRIADTVAVALEPVGGAATFYQKSLRVVVDGQEVRPDPQNGWVYDELTHSIRFQGTAKKKAFLAKIDITYEEHM